MFPQRFFFCGQLLKAFLFLNALFDLYMFVTRRKQKYNSTKFSKMTFSWKTFDEVEKQVKKPGDISES
jgi:hypothetical protein